MKQTDLANQLGISKSYLSMILSGKRTPSPEVARIISSQKVHNFEAGFSLRGRCPRPLDECATEFFGWPLWTVPELSFEKKQFILILQELLVSYSRPAT